MFAISNKLSCSLTLIFKTYCLITLVTLAFTSGTIIKENLTFELGKS